MDRRSSDHVLVVGVWALVPRMVLVRGRCGIGNWGCSLRMERRRCRQYIPAIDL